MSAFDNKADIVIRNIVAVALPELRPSKASEKNSLTGWQSARRCEWGKWGRDANRGFSG